MYSDSEDKDENYFVANKNLNIKDEKGGILLAVFRAKLSEGIDFKDD